MVHDFPTQEGKSRQPSLRFGISEKVVTSRECLDKIKIKKQTSNQDPKKVPTKKRKGEIQRKWQRNKSFWDLKINSQSRDLDTKCTLDTKNAELN